MGYSTCKSIIALPEDYTIIDLETTGFDPKFDAIIEVACIRVRKNIIVDSFSSLINPGVKIDPFITALTGITNDMLNGAPSENQIIPKVKEFIGEDIIIGHNIPFDMRFLKVRFDSILNCNLENDSVNTICLSHKLMPQLDHYTLADILSELNISSSNLHRAMSDCDATMKCYIELRNRALELYGDEANFKKLWNKNHAKIDLRTISASSDAEFDEDNILFKKHCVFTGSLSKLTRYEAAQLVTNLGGICDNGITKKTNFLILGNGEYCSTVKGGKSAKRKKAEEYKLAGIDIEILSENIFYSLIGIE